MLTIESNSSIALLPHSPTYGCPSHSRYIGRLVRPAAAATTEAILSTASTTTAGSVWWTVSIN